MIFNFGAIRNKYGTLRRDIEEQSSFKVVTAGERQCERDSERGWSDSADIRKMA